MSTDEIAEADRAAENAGLQTYVNCIAEVRQRVGAIRWAVASVEVLEKESFVFAEVIFIQLRKILELIAFATLTANKDAYAAAEAKFASHYKAKRILEAVERVNPNFYPVPLQNLPRSKGGIHELALLAEGWLTKEEFAYLYDRCGDALHVRNPFSEKDKGIYLGRSVIEWVARIQALLRFHLVNLAGSDIKWVVDVPAQGAVRVLAAVPTLLPPGGQEPGEAIP